MSLSRPVQSVLLLMVSCVLTAPVQAARFELSGVEDQLAANVRAMLSIDDALEQEPLPTASRLRYLHRKAEEEIRLALQPFGYYNPVLQLSLNLEGEPAQWLADYRVEPGPQVQVGRTHMVLEGEGAEDPVLQQAIADSPLKTGTPLLHARYSDLKSALQSRAAERGYYEAVFRRSVVRVDPTENRADVELIYDTGARAHIGEIRFDPAPVSEELLRRYLPFQSGDPINTARLVELQRRLINSNYFADVEVRPRLDQLEDAKLPVDVGLTANKRSLYQAGFGYGTDTGARMQLGLTRRWVNSRGHSLESLLRLSEIRQQARVSYLIPGSQPATDRFAFNLNLEDEQSDSIDARSYTIGGSWLKQIGPWERRLSLDWEQESWITDGIEYDSTLLIPRARFSRTLADNRLNTTRGHLISFGVGLASENLLSDTDLLQLDLLGKRVDSLSEHWRLLTRAEAGLTLVDSVDDLPATMRYYAGGDTSVRGYDYQSLGPEGSDGDVTGGRYLVAASVEVDYLFRENWRMAAFVDSGNAFDDSNMELKTGAGMGIRWQSPVGPIRLDLAVPLDESGWRIHFSLGPDL